MLPYYYTFTRCDSAAKTSDFNNYHATEWQNQLVMSCYRDWETDRKSTRLNSSHSAKSRMPSSA